VIHPDELETAIRPLSVDHRIGLVLHTDADIPAERVLLRPRRGGHDATASLLMAGVEVLDLAVEVRASSSRRALADRLANPPLPGNRGLKPARTGDRPRLST
jgi:hypothetical protein